MPSETLSGEVYARIEGKWKLVLTASGKPVTDRREWSQGDFFTSDARDFRVFFNHAPIVDVTSIRFPYSGA